MATTHPTTHQPCCRRRSEPVPLALWPVAQQTAQYQRAERYNPGSVAHPGKMLPALAQRIVAEYSKADDLVCDPMCGVGTTLVEAAALGRRAVGLELEASWARLARANLRSALDAEHRRLAVVRTGDATKLPGRLADLTGRVDLICTSPPYGCDAGVIDKPGWLAGRRLCPSASLNYSTDRHNLGHVRGERYAKAMAAVYAGCFDLLRSGGVLVVVTKNTRRGGRLFDLAALSVELGRQAGFAYLGHVVALHAAVRDGELVGRPSYWQLSALRRSRSRGEPLHLVAHEDVVVLRKVGGDADGR